MDCLSNNECSINTSYQFPITSWFFVSMTWDGRYVKVYINGNFLASSGFSPPPQINSLPLEIGRDTPGLTEYHIGNLDDIRIYNRALSEEEIDSLYLLMTNIGKLDNEINSNFKLYQNYPNPFTSTTTLSYTLNKPSKVFIRIFNSQGQQVEKIVREQQKGKQQVQWNVEGLPVGMYYFRIYAGEQIGSGKMVLMK